MKPEELVYTALNLRVPLEELVLHDTPNGAVTLMEAREKVQELVAMLLSEKTDTERLKAIGDSFQTLPEADRMFGGKILSWEEVYAAIPNREGFLKGIKSLSKPTAYWINEQGELVIGDGHSGIRSENKGEAPLAAKARAESVPNRALITEEEYRRVTSMPRGAQFEKVLIPDREGIWIQSKSGKHKIASWSFGNLTIVGNGHKIEHSQVSSRYVVRTPLNPQAQ